MSITLELEIPDKKNIRQWRLPAGVQSRLQQLLDRQDSGKKLTEAERKEAEGLVELSELLSLIRIRSRRKTK